MRLGPKALSHLRLSSSGAVYSNAGNTDCKGTSDDVSLLIMAWHARSGPFSWAPHLTPPWWFPRPCTGASNRRMGSFRTTVWQRASSVQLGSLLRFSSPHSTGCRSQDAQLASESRCWARHAIPQTWPPCPHTGRTLGHRCACATMHRPDHRGSHLVFPRSYNALFIRAMPGPADGRTTVQLELPGQPNPTFIDQCVALACARHAGGKVST